MDFKLLENTKDLSEAFIDRFVMSWDEFQIDLKDFIAEMKKKNHPVDFAFYEQSLFWDRMGTKYPYVSMDEALAFLREHNGPVYFMGEKGEDGFWRGKRVVDFIAEADANTGELYWGERLIASAVKDLNDLENVILDNVVDGYVLTYDEAQSAWVSKSVTDVIGIMTGADSENMGSGGLVPAPGVGEQNYFLRGDGVWALPEISANLSADEKSIVIENNTVSLNDFGKRYYLYVAGTETVAAHYVEQEVNSEYPWKVNLEPKVASRDGELVLGWFEPNPITVENVSSQVIVLQNNITNLENIIGSPAEEGKPATGLYAKADADNVYTKAETDSKIAEAVTSAAHLKRKIFESFVDAENFANSQSNPDDYIYMIKSSEMSDDNKYDEYLWIDGTLEKVGAWEIDLTDYATKSEVDLKVDKKDGYELISSLDILKLQGVENGAQQNVINTVDETEFNIVDKHLSINRIDVSKIKHFERAKSIVDLNNTLNALSKKVDTNTSSISSLNNEIVDIEQQLNNYVTIAKYTAEMAEVKEAIKWHKL